MRSVPVLHSQHLQDDVTVYNSLQQDVAASSPPFPSFSTSVHNVDPSIEHEMGFTQSHGPGSHSHTHLQHNRIHIDTAITSQAHSATRQNVVLSSPTAHQHEFTIQPSPSHTPTSSLQTLSHNSDGALAIDFDMLPPPNSTHSTWQELHDFAQLHASAHGYALSINTTAKNRSRIKLACVCYGQPKNTHKLTAETRVRKNRVSYKTGCRMWIEGKKQDDGSWILKVGEPNHNHSGRSIEGWAVQRKRTWGVRGGRIGVGGVTAKEEKQRMQGDTMEGAEDEQNHTGIESIKPTHSLERGGIVWKIVEQEMMRKNLPGQGRDRGVGRTVNALQERLPGIRIFKRDVYNIRAQIKRARKAAGQELGDGLESDIDEEVEAEGDVGGEGIEEQEQEQEQEQLDMDIGDRNPPEIDPMLVAQCNDALKNVSQQEDSEVDRLRREVEQLRQALAQRTQEVEAKNGENERLRVQVELASMGIYNERTSQAD